MSNSMFLCQHPGGKKARGRLYHHDPVFKGWLQKPTLVCTSQAPPGILHFLVPTIQNRCGLAGNGPGKEHKDDPGTRKPVI